MATYFISDLHLDNSSPELTRLFLNFIEKQLDDAEKLYILGDLFEVWLGDDNQTTFNQQIINALNKLAAKIQVYLIPGNRDVLIGTKFAKAANLTLLKDPTVIDLYGQPTLLLHGDSLCSQDKTHQYFRRLTHNQTLQHCFLKLPLAIREIIVRKIRNKSKIKTSQLTQAIMDVDFTAIPKLMHYYHVQQIIYGHTHRPGIYWYFDKPEHYLKSYTLSDWIRRAHTLRCDKTGQMRLIYLRDNEDFN